MANIRCPKCGRENPDSLAVCQFCQAPLAPDTTMRLGEKPTKKNTGELEPILPDWLRDVRQQARDLAKEDAEQAATLPKIQKVEPPDLLAGLASQSSVSDDEEIPDWLASLSPKPAEKPAPPAPPAEPKSDFFSQFENKNALGSKNEPTAPEPPASPGPERDELSEWFAKASEQPAEPISLEDDSVPLDDGWGAGNKTSLPSTQEPASSQEEDLSWLRNLEEESKKTGELSAPKQGDGWSTGFDVPSQPGSGKEDLSWLNSLGALPASEVPQQGSDQTQEDLSWLDALGSVTPPASSPPAPKEDLSWLNNLGGLPVQEPATKQASQPAQDLSWLNAFADSSTPAPEEPSTPAAQEDLSWLDELKKSPLPFGTDQEQPAPEADLSWLHSLDRSTEELLDGSVSAFEKPPRQTQEPQEQPPVSRLSPRRTAPLDEAGIPPVPDWLKSAIEEPSLPLGPDALNKIREEQKPPVTHNDASAKALFGAAMLQGGEKAESSQPEPGPAEKDLVPPASNTAPFVSQDVNSIFSEDLPDWLTSAEPDRQQVEDIGVHAEGGEALSPADLPSWVQAMRPVEAVIATATPGVDDLPAEREGPLAGLKGVIPAMAFGTLRRPQPIPLKLQATTEQQASAAILEQLLQGETTPRPLVSAPEVSSQQQLRWLIAGLLLFVLAAVIFSGTQIMPVPPSLSPAANQVSTAVNNIADNAPVLIILDYEPSLAGEMEAVSGPVLDQLVRMHDPYLSFVTTSPSGNALLERLLRDTGLQKPDGTAYVVGQNYANMGYLPGGASGAQAFLQSPQSVFANSPVLDTSEYAAIFLLTDRAESGRVWVEQLQTMKQTDPTFAAQPLLAISSAQAGPMLQPYVYSAQITGMVSGLPNAASYEFQNGNRPGTARSYWDAFGVGMMMAVFLIVIGSLWSVYAGVRARRGEGAAE